MPEITASATRFIAAPPARVYELLADYVEEHPRILPEEFSDYRVETGGHGAGTVITLKVTVRARARKVRMEVTEPEAGRVLVESEAATNTVTCFTVDPAAGGSQVTIDTRFPRSAGPRGLVESLFAPRMLRQLYFKELDRLAAHLRT